MDHPAFTLGRIVTHEAVADVSPAGDRRLGRWKTAQPASAGRAVLAEARPDLVKLVEDDTIAGALDLVGNDVVGAVDEVVGHQPAELPGGAIGSVAADRARERAIEGHDTFRRRAGAVRPRASQGV